MRIAIHICAAAALVALTARAVQAEDSQRNALTVQKARAFKLEREGKRSHYAANRFDLSDLPAYRPGQKIAGTIHLWGNSYIVAGNLGDYWSAGFRRFHPEAKLDLSNLTNPLVAVPGLVTRQADIAACRPFNFLDWMAFERVFNYDPLEIAVATGSFDVSGWMTTMAILVNADNPLTEISVKQLDGIFGGPRDGAMVGTTWHPELRRGPDENIRVWGQLGLKGPWKDHPIDAYVVHILDNTNPEYLLFRGSPKWSENVHEYANYARADGSFAIAAGQVAADLSRNRFGIAISTINSVVPGTKVLAVSPRGGGPAVPLTIENVQNRTYPLVTSTFFYINRPPGQPLDPKVKEFCRYVLSREGQEAVARDGKYLPLTKAMVEEQLRKLE